MNLIEIEKLFNKKALEIEQKMKALEVRKKTGRLYNSISFKYRNGLFAFSAVAYGKFQDEGTYRGRLQTKVSARAWPVYKSNGRGRKQNGIRGLHFTEPMAAVGPENIVSIVKPFLIKAMVDDVKKQLK